MDWGHLVHNGEKLWVFVKMVLYLWLPYNEGKWRGTIRKSGPRISASQ